MKRLLLSGLLAWILIPSVGFSQKANTLSSREKKEGWVLLFDGSGTAGWTTVSGAPAPAGWEVKDGAISAKKGAKGGDIMSVGEYADFDLMADFNISAEGNSGIKYFFTQYEKGGNLGFEYQILDDKLAEDNKKANHLTGSFYDVMPPDESIKKMNAPGKWNTMRVVAKGKKVEHWLNGVKILEFTRTGKEYSDAVALSKFNKSMPAFGTIDKGHILLQEHGADVSFKNIKIKVL
ncbi:DUF1080 domain-containing protein [Dyadobacter sp. CY347]|uniref:3-keto-disaccharide hydrolase n=1 Tax=Dyadobacter sp. CY347 TaxID=2909336 RepID=UPI001F1913BE|nr:DUF1080 domain-containing protein [Dyadobacter sp. CY347]MCF2489262.1 DUF1080 domain-containing protein [Dyadobacter sp. CY347]